MRPAQGWASEFRRVPVGRPSLGGRDGNFGRTGPHPSASRARSTPFRGVQGFLLGPGGRPRVLRVLAGARVAGGHPRSGGRAFRDTAGVRMRRPNIPRSRGCYSGGRPSAVIRGPRSGMGRWHRLLRAAFRSDWGACHWLEGSARLPSGGSPGSPRVPGSVACNFRVSGGFGRVVRAAHPLP